MHVGVAMPGRVEAVPGGGSSKSSSAAAGRGDSAPDGLEIIYCTAVVEPVGLLSESAAGRAERRPRATAG